MLKPSLVPPGKPQHGSPDTRSRLTRQFFLGFIRIHILHHAAKEPSVYGVGLTEELARHGYHLSPGTLYPILHGLESSGYLHSKAELHGGRRRKCYRVTSSGRMALNKARKQIMELVEEVMEDGPD